MTALDEYYPFDSGAGAGATEDAWRQMAQTWAPSGVVAAQANELECFGDSSGLQVKVKTGDAWILGHLGRCTAQKTLTLSTANPSNPRIDRIVVRLDTTANTVSLEVLTGTPAGSPTAPALTRSSTTWEFSLAQVAVAAAASTISAGNVTDERPIATPYGSVRYPSTTARDLHLPSPSAGMKAVVSGVESTYNGSAWAPPTATSMMASNCAITAGSTVYGGPGGNTSATEADVQVTVTTAFTLSQLRVLLNANGSPGSVGVTIRKNGSSTSVTASGITGTTGSDTTHSVTFAVGDKLSWSIAGSGSPTATRVGISFQVAI